MLTTQATFTKMYKLQGEITQEILGLRMPNFQGIISDEHKHIGSVPLAAALNLF